MKTLLRAIVAIGLVVACTEPSPESMYVGEWVLTDTALSYGPWVPATGGTVSMTAAKSFEMRLPFEPARTTGDWVVANNLGEIEVMTNNGGWYGRIERPAGGPFLIIVPAGGTGSIRFAKK